jgi:hypothetical protein
MGFQNLTPASKSATAKLNSGETWSISYVDGSSASGNVCLDTVQVGTTTVTSQGVEAAKSASSDFISDPREGLPGLAFNSINTASPTQQKNFFSNAISTLAAPLLTANREKGASGNYDFGYIDASEYTNAITYVPGNAANGFWEFTGNGYSVGAGPSDQASSTPSPIPVQPLFTYHSQLSKHTTPR